MDERSIKKNGQFEISTDNLSGARQKPDSDACQQNGKDAADDARPVSVGYPSMCLCR
jgi:hypothetical protein